MTEDEIAAVQESWALVLPISDAAMQIFYDRLFALDPDIGTLFAGKEMGVQRQQLARALDAVVSQLHQPQALSLPLQRLGARHATYGVREDGFSTVGAALLFTLEQGLADSWTGSVAQSWRSAWDMVRTQVLIGFREQQAA
jgi:hemoglobin-like flavoprotein